MLCARASPLDPLSESDLSTLLATKNRSATAPKCNNPRRWAPVTPPRITNSEVLLTGLLRCESCGGNMMLRTGTGKSGGRYRYYTCASHQIKGGSACHRPVSVPEAELDRLVVTGLADQLLTPDRLTILLREALLHRRATASSNTAQRSALRNNLKSTETQIDRLLTAVAEGAIPDASALRRKMADLNGRRDECLNLLSAIDNDLPELRQSLSKQQAASIAKNLKQRLLEAPHATPYRSAMFTGLCRKSSWTGK